MTLPQRIKIAEQLVRRIEWPDLDLAALRRFVEAARNEVVPPATSGDGTRSRIRTADLVADAEVVVCGTGLVPVVASAFKLPDGNRAWIKDGVTTTAGMVIATFVGPENSMRPAVGITRTALRRLSGIASFSRKHVLALGDGRTRLLDAGEFTPGWRMLEKYALACGGAWDGGNDLTRTLIETEGRVVSELETAIRRSREATPEVPVGITVRNPRQVANAASALPDLIRLEAFPISKIRDAVACVNGRAFVAAHGGIALSNIAAYAGLGLDFVSVDGLVSDAPWAPLSAVWRD